MSDYIIRSFSKSGKGGINKDCKFVDYSRNIAIIADGISDSRAGMQAAYYAVNGVKFQLSLLADKVRIGDVPKDGIETKIERAILFTNQVMAAISERVESYKGWGATLDCCFFYDGTAYIGHVGDSGVYYLRKNSKKIKPLTKDHVIPPPDLNQVPRKYRNIAAMFSRLDNYVGSEDMYVEILSQRLNVGDTILMATDGLDKLVTEPTLRRILSKYSFSRRMKTELVRRLKRPSQHARRYVKFRDVSYERAVHNLTDDVSLIAIKRMS